MAFDVNKLRTGEKVVALCAVLLFIDMFIAWYGVGGDLGRVAGLAGVTTTASAWRSFDVLDIYLLLVILIALGLVVLKATQRTPALPVAASVIVTVLAALATLLVLYRILNQPGPNDLVDVKIGAYLGFLLALGLTAGGFMAMREEGTSFADARAQAESMVASRGTTVPGADPAPTAPPAAAPDAGATPPATPPPATTAPPPAPGGPAEGV